MHSECYLNSSFKDLFYPLVKFLVLVYVWGVFRRLWMLWLLGCRSIKIVSLCIIKAIWYLGFSICLWRSVPRRGLFMSATDRVTKWRSSQVYGLIKRVTLVLMFRTLFLYWRIYFIKIEDISAIFGILWNIVDSVAAIFEIICHCFIFLISRGIRPIKLPFFVIISIRIRTLCFTAPCLDIILVEGIVIANTFSFWAGATIYAFNALLFWPLIVPLFSHLLFFLSADKCESKNVSVWI